jgi:protein-S-isoprenylcysteine O-methyltransferase Ste14
LSIPELNVLEKEIKMNMKADHPQARIDAPILLAVAILFTIALQWLIPLPFFPALPSRIIGATLFIVGFALGFPALRGMLHAKTSPNPHRSSTALVRGVTYRFTRNPMYLGMLISYSGLFIFFQNPWFLLFLPFLVWMFTSWVILPEEKYLEEKFGSEYLDFKSHVRRWI